MAIDRLLAGGLVAIPTETVYGLGALASNAEAISRVFEIKQRPSDHPLIVHVASFDHLDGWVAPLNASARRLAAACWPGPLTVLVRRGPRVLDEVTGGRPTVAVRVPAHPMTLDLLERLDDGLVAPSANRFGHVSPTTARHVADDLGDRLTPGRDAILDGGSCPVGVESTIVDCTTDPPQVLRPGGITSEEISRLLDGDLAPARGPSRAAGMMASHYAPRCQVELAESLTIAQRSVAAHREQGRHADVLDLGDDLVVAARSLYEALRAADRRSVEVLVAVLPPPHGLGHALRDRLSKAATPSASPGDRSSPID